MSNSAFEAGRQRAQMMRDTEDMSHTAAFAREQARNTYAERARQGIPDNRALNGWNIETTSSNAFTIVRQNNN